MVNLGLWQLRRLDERRDQNAVVSARLAEPPAPLGELLDPDSSAADVAGAANRRVTVSGTYEPDEQVLVRSRSLDGSPGSWVLTPLPPGGRLDRRREPGLDRQRRHLRRRAHRPYAPAEGTVRVEGLAPGEPGARGGSGPPTRRRAGSRAWPGWTWSATRSSSTARSCRAGSSSARSARSPRPGADVPVALDPPELDSGPHFSYAVQWFIFSTIAIVGYPLILRRNATGAGHGRGRHRGADPASGRERPGRWEGVNGLRSRYCARWRPGPCWPRRRRWSSSVLQWQAPERSVVPIGEKFICDGRLAVGGTDGPGRDHRAGDHLRARAVVRRHHPADRSCSSGCRPCWCWSRSALLFRRFLAPRQRVVRRAVGAA